MNEQYILQGFMAGTFFTSLIFLFLIFRKDLMRGMGWKEGMDPLDIYRPLVKIKHKGMLGRYEVYESIQNHKIDLIRTFWEDNDVQEIMVISTNFGFIDTYTKLYKNEAEDEDSTP